MQLDSVKSQDFADPVDMMSTQRGVPHLKVEGRIERPWAFSDAVPEVSARSREKHIDFNSAAWRWYVDSPSEMVVGIQRVTAFLTENATKDLHDGHERWVVRPFFKLRFSCQATIQQDVEVRFTFFLRDGTPYSTVFMPLLHLQSGQQHYEATVELAESIFDIVYYGRLDLSETLAADGASSPAPFRPIVVTNGNGNGAHKG